MRKVIERDIPREGKNHYWNNSKKIRMRKRNYTLNGSKKRL